VKAAAAEEIGAAGHAGGFQILQAEEAAEPEMHVMEGVLAGLAATRDRRAAAIVLAKAQPGVPERVRLSALAGLAALKGVVEMDHRQELTATVGAALEDPFLPVRQMGEQLAGEFRLVQFEGEIEKDLTAPLILARESARRVLEQLQVSSK
jgi:hypothetical protein